MAQMNSDVRMSYIKETTAGVLPASPNMQTLRFNSETFGLSKTLVTNNEITPIGVKNFDFHGARTTSGAFAYQLTYDTYDEFIQGAFRNDWSTPIVVTDTLSITASTKRVSGADFQTAGVLVGDVVRLEGFLNTENNVDAIVTAVTTTYIDIDATGLIDETGDGGESVTTAAKLIVAKNDRSFSFEKSYSDAEDAEVHQLFKGQYVSTFDMTVPQDGIITGNFSFNGMGYVDSATENGASYLDVDTNEPFNGFTVEGYISVDGSVAGCVQSFDFAMNNNYEGIRCLFNPDPKSIQRGALAVSGNISVIVTSKAIFDKFVNEEIGDLKLKLEDVHGNAYYIWIPKVKYNSASDPTNSNTGAKTVSLAFQGGIYVDQGGTNIIMQKFDARV